MGDSVDGGGARFGGRTVDLYKVVFRNNSAFSGKGGGVMSETKAHLTLRNCVFVDNKAAYGGALAGAGAGATVHVISSTFEGANRALNEGGCIYLGGSCAMTLNNTNIKECVSRSHGGGASTRDNSFLTVMGGVVIDRCESLEGNGGGVQMGGLRLDVLVPDQNAYMVVQNNKARRGGGVSAMGIVNFGGPARTVVQGNSASENGGGVYGFSSFARLKIEPGHTLSIENNLAVNDGGGLFLSHGGKRRECVYTCF